MKYIKLCKPQRSLGAWKYAKQRGYYRIILCDNRWDDARSGKTLDQGGEWYVTRHGVLHDDQTNDWINRLLKIASMYYRDSVIVF